MKYDLEERTAKFGEAIIQFCKQLKLTPINQPLTYQLIKSATSIGANYMEANGGSSKKDFRNKIYISKKEAHETKHWLRMLMVANPEHNKKCGELWNEAQEITLIFGKILSKINSNN